MLVGRPYEVMQSDLDGDFSKMHVKIKFRIKDVVGNDALTEFVGHDVMKDFVRRQIRRDRGKVDDTIDVVTDDGFFIRIKPFIVTRSRVKGSQKQETRSVARNEVITFCAKATWIGVQQALLDGSLEERVTKAVSKIQPVRAVFFRRSQLIQDGVVIDDGPTLEEVKAAEKESIEAANKSSEDEGIEPEEADVETEELAEIGDAEISDDAITEDQKVSEKPSEEVEETSPDFESMTVVQLKELLKKAGKPVSGKKADLVARLSE